MENEPGKYSVIELSEKLGVKRTTVNDWLAKYAMYIEFTIQGKRRIYSDTTLNVLKKVSELREKGLSSFEIDAELAKLYAVHPQPEPESAPAPATEEKTSAQAPESAVPERLPSADNMSKKDAELLLNQFRVMMEKLDRLEAASRALPQPQENTPEKQPEPAPVRRSASGWLLFLLFVFLAATLSAVALYSYRELGEMKQSAAKQSAEITRQRSDNARLQQEVFVLDKSRSDFEANVKRLEQAMAQEKAERTKREAESAKQLSEAKQAMETLRKSEAERRDAEAKLQQEKFAKERMEYVMKIEKMILEKEKLAAEKKVLELQSKAAAPVPQKPDAKTEVKPASKLEAKSEVKAAAPAKNDAKPASKTEVKPKP